MSASRGYSSNAKQGPLPFYMQAMDVSLSLSVITALIASVHTKDGDGEYLDYIQGNSNHNVPQSYTVAEIYNNALGNPAGIPIDKESSCNSDKMILLVGHMVRTTLCVV